MDHVIASGSNLCHKDYYYYFFVIINLQFCCCIINKLNMCTPIRTTQMDSTSVKRCQVEIIPDTLQMSLLMLLVRTTKSHYVSKVLLQNCFT